MGCKREREDCGGRGAKKKGEKKKDFLSSIFRHRSLTQATNSYDPQEHKNKYKPKHKEMEKKKKGKNKNKNTYFDRTDTKEAANVQDGPLSKTTNRQVI